MKGNREFEWRATRIVLMVTVFLVWVAAVFNPAPKAQRKVAPVYQELIVQIIGPNYKPIVLNCDDLTVEQKTVVHYYNMECKID